MPNVVMLIPIADTLGVTVTELLKGEKVERDASLNAEEVETLVVNSLDMSVRSSLQRHKKKWIIAYFISVFVVVAEAAVLLFSQIPFSQMGDSLYIAGLMLLFAGWLCLFAKDLLPTYYDQNKINYVSQGIFRVHMAGLSFHNGNWMQVCTVFKIFTLGTAVLYPLLCYVCNLIGGADLWEQMKYIFVGVVLLIMLAAAYIVGKKYE